MSEKKPPFVENSQKVSLEDIIQLGDRLSLTKDEKQWVHELFIGTSKADDACVSLHDFLYGKTLSAARKRIEKLFRLGFLKKSTRRLPGVKRPIAVYFFRPFDAEAARLASSLSYGQELIPEYRAGNDAILPEPWSTLRTHPKIDDLIGTVLFSGLVYGSSLKTVTYPIDQYLNWFETPVRVITHCKTGQNAARVTDLKYFFVLVTMAKKIVDHQLERGIQPRNLFTVEASQVNHQLERQSDGGNTSTAYRALKRCNATSFEIPSLPSFIMNRLDFDEGEINIDLLPDFGRFRKTQENGRQKVVFTYSLSNIIFNRMIASGSSNLFDINPSVLKENNDVLFGLYLFGKRRLAKQTKPLVTTLRDLHLAVAPQLRLSEFKENLFEGLLERHQKEIQEFPQMAEVYESEGMHIEPGRKKGTSVVLRGRFNVHGIVISIRGQDAYLVNDPADPYVGIVSRARRIQRAKATGLRDGEVTTENMIQHRLDSL